MKTRIIHFLIIFYFFFLTSIIFAQESLDQIVAIVGKDIILDSELKTQFEFYLAQTGEKVEKPEELNNLRKKLLDQMINDRLLLTKAEKDTLLKINEKEIEQTLEGQLAKIKSQFSSEEAFQKELQAEGLTEAELKRNYREQIKEQILRDKLISSKLSRANISSREVKEFYHSYKDSLPEQPESAKLSQILLKVEPSQKTLDSLKDFASMILMRAKAGEDFSELAKRYSEDPSAKQGGDLGFLKRGEILPEFEMRAFSLKPGEISDLVQTSLGYHIIKLEEKKEQEIHVRHILITITPSQVDSAKILGLADTLYQKLKNGADFVQLVKEYSQDDESKKKGGEIGWFPLSQLPEELKEKITQTEIGQITSPLITEEGVHILRILDKKEKRSLSLDDDYDTIKEMAKRKKGNDEILKWIEELKSRTYVEVRI